MLKGNQISLREYQREDLPDIVKLLNDVSAGFDLRRGAGVPLTEQDVEAILADTAGPDAFRYVVTDPQDRLIGIWKVTLSAKDQRAELDHRMLPGDRAKGYDADSLDVILRTLFGELNMNRCQTILFDFEKKALDTFLKAGFRKEAALRHHVFHQGNYHDALVLGILKKEFEARE